MNDDQLRLAFQLLDAAAISLAPCGAHEVCSPEYNAITDLRSAFEHDHDVRYRRLNASSYGRIVAALEDIRIDSMKEIGE